MRRGAYGVAIGLLGWAAWRTRGLGVPFVLAFVGLGLWAFVWGPIRVAWWFRRAERAVRIADERRRQGLCARCGYDLTGNVSGVCPECGTRAGGAGGLAGPGDPLTG